MSESDTNSIKKSITSIKKELDKKESFDNITLSEDDIYRNSVKVKTILLYPKNKKMKYVIDNFTSFLKVDYGWTTFEEPWSLDSVVKHGIKSENYEGDKLVWGKPSNQIYSHQYLNELLTLIKTLDDKKIKICDSNEGPIYIESDSLRGVIAHRFWGRDV